MSAMCALHAFPDQMPRSSDTAYVSGKTRAIASSAGGRPRSGEEPGQRNHRIHQDGAERLREAGGRHEARDDEADRQEAPCAEDQGHGESDDRHVDVDRIEASAGEDHQREGDRRESELYQDVGDQDRRRPQRRRRLGSSGRPRVPDSGVRRVPRACVDVDDPAVFDDGDATAEPLRLLHQVSRQEHRLAPVLDVAPPGPRSRVAPVQDTSPPAASSRTRSTGAARCGPGARRPRRGIRSAAA